MTRFLSSLRFFCVGVGFFSAALVACGGTASDGGDDAGGGGSSSGGGAGESGGSSSTGGGSGESCSYEGNTYEDGDGFPSADGCNACTCESGTVSCTVKDCEATACGGMAGMTCSDDEYCAYEPGDLCGQADAQSVCRTRPVACDASFMPVCGCDGETYSNGCSANAAGQGVMSEGECPD